MTDSFDNWGFDTRAVRVGHTPTAEGEQAEPIFTTSSYTFATAAEAAARFSGESPGNIYSRFTNPTVRAFEQRLAALEGGERCIATASGMAAILTTVMALLKAGDHIVSSRAIFGTTSILFNNYISKFGVDTTYVPLSDLNAWSAAITPRTRLLFVETPSNPLTELVDIEALAVIARSAGCLLVVDNCFCTPALQQPLAMGAHLVIHSATKYIDGQGRCIGGAIIGSHDLVGKDIYGFLRTAGPSMSPFNAWVFLKGLETLSLRMKAHCENAMQVARWLEQQPGVHRVYYPGLPSHPQHALAARQQRGFGAIVSFEVEGHRDQAWRVVDQLQLISVTANLGDTKTTITHPATTTHGRLTPEQRDTAGIKDSLLRIAVGIEDCDDLMGDLAQALAARV